MSPANQDATWYHKLPLENEYKSFEVKFEDFYWMYHGRPNPNVDPPNPAKLRRVRINISDGKSEPFEADFNLIEADNFQAV